MAFGDNQIDGYAEGEKPLTFHHQTGEYRKTEPQKAQDLASGKAMPKRGFFRVLVSTTGNRSIFTVLCLTIILVLLVSVFGKSASEATIDGLQYQLKATLFAEKVFVSLEVKEPAKKNDAPKEKNSGLQKLVDAKFDLLDANKTVTQSRESKYIYGGKAKTFTEEFQDYETAKVSCIVTCGGKSAILTAKAEQR